MSNTLLYFSAMMITLSTLHAAEHLEPSTGNELMPRILTMTEVSSKSTSRESSQLLGFQSPGMLNLSGIQLSENTDPLARPLTFYEGTSLPTPIPGELNQYAENPGQNDKPLFVLPKLSTYSQQESAIDTSPGISFLVETPSVTSQTQPHPLN